MPSIVMIGGGGHCKSVLDAVIGKKQYDEIVITDPILRKGSRILGCEVVGDDNLLNSCFENGFRHACISVGSTVTTDIRHQVQKRAEDIGYYFPQIIDLSAAVSHQAMIERGSFIGKCAAVNAEASIGEFAIINTGAIIEHECTIGSFSHIAVGAVICGGCTIEKDVFVGANATVIQGVKIGKNSIVGAGSIILKDVPEGSKVVGIWNG